MRTEQSEVVREKKWQHGTIHIPRDWPQDDSSLDKNWLHCSLVSYTHSHVTSKGTANVKGMQCTLWHLCGILHSGVPGHRSGRTNKQRTTYHLTRKMHVSQTISVFVLIAPTAHRINVEMDRKLHSAMALRVPWEQWGAVGAVSGWSVPLYLSAFVSVCVQLPRVR
jgi:hypothetical protein